MLAEPEGNELCVIEPGHNFLADCGFLGALACDGPREVGYFWSEAAGRPLQEILDAARSLSPVFDTVTKPVAVAATLQKES